MISIDFECCNRHRFEGCFNDYRTYREQLDSKLVACPVCETFDVKRIYTGCSIQTKSSTRLNNSSESLNLFQQIRALNNFVKENFENVGQDFCNTARSIHYGLEEEKPIYGNTTYNEARELVDEGIEIFPLIEIDNLEN